MTTTYTTKQAAALLGIKTQTLQRRYLSRYPAAFVVIKKGGGKGIETLYDKKQIDKLVYYLQHLEALQEQIA